MAWWIVHHSMMDYLVSHARQCFGRVEPAPAPTDRRCTTVAPVPGAQAGDASRTATPHQMRTRLSGGR